MNFHRMHQEKQKTKSFGQHGTNYTTKHSQLAQQSFIAVDYMRHSLYVILLVEKMKIQLKSKTK